MRLIHNLLGDFSFETPEGIINHLAQYTSRELRWSAEKLAEVMLTDVYKHHKKDWIKLAQDHNTPFEIYRILQMQMSGAMGDLIRRKVDENAFLITTTPLAISKYLTNYLLEESQKGRRSSDIAEDIAKKYPNILRSRVNLIARTEVSKASTALTRAQSRELNLNWYIWRTSEDGRVRDSHHKMQDVLVNWNDPPSPEKLVGQKSAGHYAPGEIYNCRCYAEPVLDLRDVSWPHRVYINGQIIRMRKHEFERMVA